MALGFCGFTSGVFRNLKRGAKRVQKCSSFSIQKLFTLKISTEFFSPSKEEEGERRSSIYALGFITTPTSWTPLGTSVFQNFGLLPQLPPGSAPGPRWRLRSPDPLCLCPPHFQTLAPSLANSSAGRRTRMWWRQIASRETAERMTNDDRLMPVYCGRCYCRIC